MFLFPLIKRPQNFLDHCLSQGTETAETALMAVMAPMGTGAPSGHIPLLESPKKTPKKTMLRCFIYKKVATGCALKTFQQNSNVSDGSNHQVTRPYWIHQFSSLSVVLCESSF